MAARRGGCRSKKNYRKKTPDKTIKGFPDFAQNSRGIRGGGGSKGPISQQEQNPKARQKVLGRPPGTQLERRNVTLERHWLITTPMTNATKKNLLQIHWQRWEEGGRKGALLATTPKLVEGQPLCTKGSRFGPYGTVSHRKTSPLNKTEKGAKVNPTQTIVRKSRVENRKNKHRKSFGGTKANVWKPAKCSQEKDKSLKSMGGSPVGENSIRGGGQKKKKTRPEKKQRPSTGWDDSRVSSVKSGGWGKYGSFLPESPQPGKKPRRDHA